ncbi:tyrosine-type recombinase/integrase [candidate division KSB1 bacterium]|nr:tyrosine-type recombinase/integrase [candidate division KSB1 bacterium]
MSIQQNSRSVKYLTQEELTRFFAKIKAKRDRAMFNIIYKHGLRASEVRLLKIADIDLVQRRIKITRVKGGVDGEYEMFADSVRLVKAYLKEREQDFYPALFLSRKKGALARQTIDNLFRVYAPKAKLPTDKWHAHVLRHSIAVHMADAGFQAEHVKFWLGHRHLSSTEVYFEISRRKGKQIKESMERAREILAMPEDWKGLAAGVALAEGLLAATQERWEVAEAAFHQAVDTNQEYGLVYDQARVLYQWAVMVLDRPAAGGRQRGLELLDQSLTLYRQCHAMTGVERVTAFQVQIESRPDSPPAYPDGLTEREVGVLRLIAAAKTDREIGDDLVIAPGTVRRHISNIYAKIGTKNRAEATRYALGQDLLPMDYSHPP